MHHERNARRGPRGALLEINLTFHEGLDEQLVDDLRMYVRAMAIGHTDLGAGEPLQGPFALGLLKAMLHQAILDHPAPARLREAGSQVEYCSCGNGVDHGEDCPRRLSTPELVQRGRGVLDMAPADFYALTPDQKTLKLDLLDEWSARWHAAPRPRPVLGSGSDHELELLDEVRSELRRGVL